ncbi:MAG: hypothetical protein WC503_02760 [Candidatus Shapirobacteria bacterium]
MRFLEYLREDFVGYLEGYNKTVEVFVDPSQKEMREAAGNGNSVRFIGLNKKLFVWNSWGLLHDDVAPQIGAEKYKPYGFFGEARYSRGKLSISWIEFRTHFPEIALKEFKRFFLEDLEHFYLNP